MKKRIGFVSNSSSSSFILAVKDIDKKDVEQKLLESLKVPADSPLYSIAKEIAELFASCIEGDGDIEQIAKNEGFENVGEYLAEKDRDNLIFKAVKNGMKVYTGYFGDEDGGTEELLCNTEFEINEPNLIVSKEGGY